jgi:hypothetical protein
MMSSQPAAKRRMVAGSLPRSNDDRIDEMGCLSIFPGMNYFT